MEILEIKNNIVQPTPEILSIKVFAKIWDRDKSKRKELAVQELSFIGAMCSRLKTNPFREYEESVREEKVVSAIIKKKGWKPDSVIEDAIIWYKEWQQESSASMRYYEANLGAIEKTIVFLTDELDYTEKNKSGMPVYKFTDIVRGIKDADNVLKSLGSLRKKVETDLYEASKTKGDKEINHYEK